MAPVTVAGSLGLQVDTGAVEELMEDPQELSTEELQQRMAAGELCEEAASAVTEIEEVLKNTQSCNVCRETQPRQKKPITAFTHLRTVSGRITEQC